MSLQPPSTARNPLFRFAFYGLAIGLALVHVFITFRGLSSPAGMEQAQVARELARGNVFQTKVIRPYAWALLNEARAPASPAGMADITQPPLQPMLWAPAFRLLQDHLAYEPRSQGSIYLLDRVIACYGVVGLLLTLLWTHGAARVLFDEKVAAVAVLALLVCEPLWDLAVSGSPVATLLPLVAVAFRLLVSAAVSSQEGKSSTLSLLLLGLVAALLVLTHWLAVWLALALVLATVVGLPQRRSGALLVGIFPALALAGWGWWLQQRCGDPLGAAKTLFQAHLLSLDGSLLQRQFALTMPPVQVADLLRKLLQNWQSQLGSLPTYLGYVLPAMAFVAALMHRFRRTEAATLRLSLGVLCLCVALAMGFVGLPGEQRDDNAFYPLLIPGLSIYGSAMLAILWARLYPTGQGLWTRWGYAFLALGLTALPLLNVLPAQVKLGLTLRNRIYPHWPPYVPDRVSLVRRLIEPNELLFSDAPWFVAWYADTPTAWIPVKRDDFTRMESLAKEAGTPVAGFIMTPVSTQVTHLHEVFTGPYSEWPDLLFRGPLMAFDRDFPARVDFEYKIPVALVAIPVGPRESLSLQMTFYTNRARTLRD